MLDERNYSLGYPRISECEVSVEFIQRVMRGAWRKALTPPRCIRIFEAAHVHDNDASSTSAAERSTSSSAERCPTNSAANSWATDGDLYCQDGKSDDTATDAIVRTGDTACAVTTGVGVVLNTWGP